ncbi:MAG: cysteine--tRNA ligase [Deltaproteobacteria bacterium]|nr:cysteine--tRNA ligase [Deltaproteobacteria bacterium]MCB9788061.1 cysteine--tRNA ligase [Deltaproteobacteria bacterium]
MALAIYNTMTRAKEPFEPLVSGKVGLYVCGVTVYDLSHIGHARVYVAFDAVYRFLRQQGYEVTYVRNFTDVDDKIIARATERGEDPLALSARFIEEYHRDMDALGCLRPTLEPKVSTHMPQIIAMIERIIERGHAYVVEGDVYFSIDSYPSYGKLSRCQLDEMRAGERVQVDERKRNPFDFALWKAAKPGEPTWESPWGPGRPGWHIECSAMSCAHLGETFDIHAGGKDLVFPHHENEIAQSEAASGVDYVRYWMHNGFVNVDAEKMSKSLGNFFTIRDVLELYHPLSVRWFLLSTHYRAPINYTERTIEEAAARVYYLYQTLHDLDVALAEVKSTKDGDVVEPEMVEAISQQATAAMEDDFNTALLVSVLSEPLKLINDLLHTKKGRKRAGRLRTMARIREQIRPIFDVIGVGRGEPARILAEMRQRALRRHGLSEEHVLERVAARVAAREARDWAAADAIRDELLAAGVQLMDAAAGTDWRPVFQLVEEGGGAAESEA